MTRHASIVTLSVGLLAGLVPACTHSTGIIVKPAAAPNPAAVSDVNLVQEPRWPIEISGGEETQSVAPETPGTGRSPYSSSFLTGTSNRTVKKTRTMQQTEDLLSPDPPVLLAPRQAPEPSVGSVPPTPPPAQGDDKKAPRSAQPIVLALESLLNDHPQEALEYLKSYDTCNQEALICLTATVARLTKKKLDQLSPAEVVALLDQLQKSLLALRPRAELLIDKMCFCEWIKGYGVYKPLPDDYEFQPTVGDRPGEQVLIYVELRNLTSEPREDAYETRLHSTMRVFDSSGKEMVFRDFRDHESPFRTRMPLPDYFKQCWFYVPHLPPGKYLLQLEVRDVTRPEAPRVATKSLEFRVAGS